MKKLFALLLIAGCGVSFVGCGPTAEEKKPAADAPKVEPAPMGDAPATPPADPAATPTPPPADPAAPAAPAEAPKE